MEKRKTVIVVGASGGIGQEIVKIFAENNYNIVLCYNKNIGVITALCNDLLAKGINCLPIQCDISDDNSAKYIFKETKSVFGQIDVLVNAAGITHNAPLCETSISTINNLIDINLKSVILLCREAEKHLGRFGGSIINISSMWGLTGGANEVVYSATKAGIIGLSKALAKELAPSGITVNVIAPGAVNTNMLQYSPEEIENIKASTPLNRLGNPAEIAVGVYYLANAKFITGEVLNINGGFLI